MEFIETTRLSSKGQVVLPQSIRKQLGLLVGVQFVVLSDKDTIVLKRIEVPSRKQFKELVRASRSYAKKLNLRQEKIQGAIAKSRQRS